MDYCNFNAVVDSATEAHMGRESLWQWRIWKSLSRNYYMSHHILIHTGEKLFVCTASGCGINSTPNQTWRNSLNTNMKIIENNMYAILKVVRRPLRNISSWKSISAIRKMNHFSSEAMKDVENTLLCTPTVRTQGDPWRLYLSRRCSIAAKTS